MKSSHVIIFLWMCFSVDTSTPNGCSETPEVEHAEVAESSKKNHYSDGDKLDYNCVPGYVSRIKIIYKCSNNEWIKLRGENCSLKRCESPEDIPNGRYTIESGRNFVFGTTIKYICNDGYQIMSRFDTRTCRDGGWDNQLPACEEVSCERKKAEGNVRVEGYPEHPEDLIQYGHRLTFSCAGQGLIIRGPKEITCQSNGEWSSPFPKCVEVSCEEEQLINVDILTGHPGIAPPYNPGHILVFRCTDVNLNMHGQRTIECLSNGKWDHPFPKCEEATCEGEQLIGVDILIGHPHIAPPYKPGHILVFRCTDVNLPMQGQRTIECLSNGKWDQPYPKCEEIRCEVPRDQHVSSPGRFFKGNMKLGSKQHYSCESGYEKTAAEATCTQDGWRPNPLCTKTRCEVPYDQHVSMPGQYFRGDMKLGSKQYYYCESGYENMAEEATCTRDGWTPNPLCAKTTCEVPRDQHVSRPYDSFRGDMKIGAKRSYSCESGYEKMARDATCTRDGWTPNPLCAETTCEVPRDQHVSRPYDSFRGDMKLGAKISYSCESGYEKMATEATCTRDGWTPNPLCAGMTVSRKCGPPPQVINADTKDLTKNQYSTGERVEYICFNKYILDQRSPFSKYLTCQQGEWRGKIKCLEPCTVTKEIMDERGIDLAYVNQHKMFAPHNDYITFACLWGKYSVGIDFRQRCNDGKMNLPQCV